LIMSRNLTQTNRHKQLRTEPLVDDCLSGVMQSQLVVLSNALISWPASWVGKSFSQDGP
jgi:hypothetical protein